LLDKTQSTEIPVGGSGRSLAAIVRIGLGIDDPN